jgi:hypothetical protein
VFLKKTFLTSKNFHKYMPLSEYDLDVLITSIKNRVHQQNFLGATTLLIQLQNKVPEDYKPRVQAILGHVAEETKNEKHVDPSVIEHELDELKETLIAKISSV